MPLWSRGSSSPPEERLTCHWSPIVETASAATAPRDDQAGVPAKTHYEVTERFGIRASLLTCRLETGRTHQIRIHLAEIDHPVIGDPVYGRKGRVRFPVAFPRQALHAQALGFIHPMSGQELRVEAPFPADLKDLIAGLRERFGSDR